MRGISRKLPVLTRKCWVEKRNIKQSANSSSSDTMLEIASYRSSPVYIILQWSDMASSQIYRVLTPTLLLAEGAVDGVVLDNEEKLAN